MAKKFIVGNWKMNGLRKDIDILDSLVAGVNDIDSSKVEIVVCPPFTLTAGAVVLTKGSVIKVGAQDCYSEANGAYTGNVSASMLKDLGCEYVILGHSERRKYDGDSVEILLNKIRRALENNLKVIFCVGESVEERNNGKALEFVFKQLRDVVLPLGDLLSSENFIVAYEPLWAIGTGEVAESSDIDEMHKNIISTLGGICLEKVAVLYGGSVKPDNSRNILEISSVDGVLVGGASLKADSFLEIIKSA